MRHLKILILPIILINISACSTTPQVIPSGGPTMEHVYDTMNQATFKTRHFDDVDDLNSIREQVISVKTNEQTLSAKQQVRSDLSFKKIPNPELKMLVYPHLAGKEEVPIPGYTTVFNAYDHDHYALSQEIY